MKFLTFLNDCTSVEDPGNERNRPASSNSPKSDYLETVESAKQETMGSTKTWDRKRPSKTDIVSRKSLSMDSDQDMCSKGNIKKDIGKERVSKLSGLLYTKT